MNEDWARPQPESLPGPSHAPALMALGLVLLLWGIVTSWIVSLLGLIVIGWAAALWLK